MPDRNAAMGSREHFFRNTVDQMQAFAEGTGDVPMIVKRSGKSTEQGIALGRMEMSYFLGVAYLQGATVQADPGQAVRWLERAVSLGSRNAAARLGAPS
jgi:TPR repeat protein